MKLKSENPWVQVDSHLLGGDYKLAGIIIFGAFGFTALVVRYSVMQSDWNSSKTVTFYEPTTYEQHV